MAFVTNTGESFYNALNVTLNKNVSKGLQFQAAYTWAKASDAQQGSTAVDTPDITSGEPFCIRFQITDRRLSI